MAQDQTTPSGYAGFAAALASLTAGGSDMFQNERHVARMELIRQKVTDRMLAAFPMIPPPPTPPPPPPAPPDAPKLLSLDGALDVAALLCSVRYQKALVIVKNLSVPRDKDASITLDHLGTAAQQAYLSAATHQLQNAAVAKPSGILDAIKILFRDYHIKPLDPPAVPQKTRDDTQKSCEADLREFDAAYYGAAIPVPPSPSALAATAAGDIPDLSPFGPVGALVSTFLGILQPVLDDFAQVVNEAETRKAIGDFLKNAKPNLIASGTGFARTTSDYLFAKRMTIAGTFAEQIALIGANPLDLASKDVKAACPQTPTDVTDMYKRAGSGRVTAKFMVCYHAVWSHFEESINAALKTADAYDQMADNGNTSRGLNGFIQLTGKDKDGVDHYDQMVDAGGQVDLWATVTEMITFASAVVTATSQDSVTKLQKALDAVSKGK